MTATVKVTVTTVTTLTVPVLAKVWVAVTVTVTVTGTVTGVGGSQGDWCDSGSDSVCSESNVDCENDSTSRVEWDCDYWFDRSSSGAGQTALHECG